MGALPVVEPWERERHRRATRPRALRAVHRRLHDVLPAARSAPSSPWPRPSPGADRAEEIAQEALLRAHREWDRIARYDKPGRLGPPRHHQPRHLRPGVAASERRALAAGRRPAPARRPAARGRRVLGARAAPAAPPGGRRRPPLPRRPEHRRDRRRPRLRRGHRQGPPAPGPPHPRRAATSEHDQEHDR